MRNASSISQVVKNKTVASNQINISDLPKGIYFIQFRDTKSNLLSSNQFIK